MITFDAGSKPLFGISLCWFHGHQIPRNNGKRERDSISLGCARTNEHGFLLAKVEIQRDSKTRLFICFICHLPLRNVTGGAIYHLLREAIGSYETRLLDQSEHGTTLGVGLGLGLG